MSLSSGAARRTISFASTELDDVDGVMAAAATSATAVTLGAEDYDGAAVSTDGTAWLKLPRTITVTLSSAEGSYSTDPIVLTGTRNLQTVTESLTPSSADGDETLRGEQLFDAPPTIAIPAQEDTSGTISIGVGDIGVPSPELLFSGVKVHAAGTLHLDYGDSTDALPASAHEVEPVAPVRILTSSELTSPTTVGITVYLD
jgi:hypothetical protein